MATKQEDVPVNADTKLSDLSDSQRAELGAKLTQEQQEQRPLIGPQESIDALEAEYANSDDDFKRKINWIKQEAGFIGIRRSRGDGSCFYRCFAFAFLQQILNFNDRPLHHFVVKHLDSLLDLLKSAGFDESVYMDFYDPLKALLSRIHSTDPETVALDDKSLLAAMNDPEISNSIVVFLRLVVSAYLKTNEEEYAPFLFSFEDEAGSDGAPTMAQFCANQVEAMGKEADHLQITALVSCLKVSLDVVYLSRGSAPPATPSQENDSLSVPIPGQDAAKARAAREHPDRCDIVSFDVEEGQMMELGHTLLLRPGHYDLLIHAPPPASPEIVIPRKS